jgi:hypothetical protein
LACVDISGNKFSFSLLSLICLLFLFTEFTVHSYATFVMFIERTQPQTRHRGTKFRALIGSFLSCGSPYISDFHNRTSGSKEITEVTT